MNGRVLLDTNIVIALFARDESVLEELNDVTSVFVPSVVLGELFYGAYRSRRFDENMTHVEEFASVIAVLDCDAATARHYAQIKNRLRDAGRPIPENDIWIAAVARQHGLTLVSRDYHFAEVEGLETVAWR
ncbi:MAG: type II toxin-antitoxin system VapC family toxin [Actinobacteria bacterium]|nr:type II toxin-antitoxin system VapC family toxin [Actinomycetota bacterium]